jgi:putative FmdB family regulatory protein
LEYHEYTFSKEVRMPIYEFRCLGCGNIVEKLILGQEEAIEMKCDQCGSQDLERVVSRASFIKGMTSKTNVKVSQRSCASGGTCASFDIPGPE